MPAAIDATIARYRALANALQDTTGADDDATLAIMAQLRQLGVLDSQMAAATQAVIALGAVNIDGERATRGVALAMAGEYAGLQRLIPEIRTAGTEEEKRAALAALVARGMEIQRQKLHTVAGAWGALKEGVEDLLVSIGKAMYGGSGFADMLLSIRERVKGIAESAGFARLVAWLKEASAEATALAKILLGLGESTTAKAGWSGVADVLIAGLKLGAAEAANLLYEAIVKGGEYLAGKFKEAGKFYIPGYGIYKAASIAGKASAGIEAGAADIADVAGKKKALAQAMAALGKQAAEEIGKAVATGITDGATQELGPGGSVDAVVAAMLAALALHGETDADREKTKAVKEQKEKVDELTQAWLDEGVAEGRATQLKGLEKEVARLEDVHNAAAEATKALDALSFAEWRAQSIAIRIRDTHGHIPAGDSVLGGQSDMDRFNKLQVKELRKGTTLSKEDQNFMADMRQKQFAHNQNLVAEGAAGAALKAAQDARDSMQGQIQENTSKTVDKLNEAITKWNALIVAPAGG
jgi:hypothetical protein